MTFTPAAKEHDRVYIDVEGILMACATAPAPDCLTYPASRISSACSCIDIPVSIISVTAAAVTVIYVVPTNYYCDVCLLNSTAEWRSCALHILEFLDQL
jgi:hypothetical protein